MRRLKMLSVIKDLKNTSSLNNKIDILKSNQTDELKLVLSLTYDKVKYTFGVKKLSPLRNGSMSLNDLKSKDILSIFSPLFKRELTGNSALDYISNTFSKFNTESQIVLVSILQRDLHAGINTKLINKCYPKLITEMPYMRCSLTDKLKNIRYPAILQLKADGTFRTFVKHNDVVSAFSRSGESYHHPLINEQLLQLPDGVYIGELIVNGITGSAQDVRYKSNGLLNSLTPPEDVTFYTWDFLTLEEFSNGLSKVQYINRFAKLTETDNIKKIRTFTVSDYNEALNITHKLIGEGEEGTILKNSSSIYKSGTSKEQIKLKPEIEVDVKCIGFTEGNGRFKDTFGAIIFESSDGLLNGQVSGLSDEERAVIARNSSDYIGRVFTVKATGISRSKTSDIYSLLHPRFNGFRADKTEADDINRILNMGL